MRRIRGGFPGRMSVLGVILAGGLGVAPGAATVVVDTFDDPGTAVSIDDPPTTSSSTLDGGAMLGGERDAEIARLSGSGTVSSDLGAGSFSFSAPAATRGRLDLSWDGTDADLALDADGLGGVDLTAGGCNTLKLTASSVTGLCELVVEVFTDASSSSRAAATIGAAGDLYFPFASFLTNLGAGADFTNVGAIALEIRGTDASCEFDDFRAVGPGLTALKTASLLTDVDMDGKADPGDTLEYEIEITADGGATGVELEDTPGLSSGLTFQASSIEVSPVAVNDGYTAAGNIVLSIPAVSGLLANDFDPDANLATPPISAFDNPSVQGGTVSVTAADGSFTYSPPPTFSGVDSFTYTLTDQDGLTDTATVSILVDGTIWFVDDTATCGAAPCGSGTQADPFKGFDPTQLNGAGGAGDVDGPGDTIFVFEGSGATDTGALAGIELEEGQTLHGEGVALVIGGQTIVAGGNRPVLTNTAGTAGHGITLAEDNNIRGLTVGDTSAGGWAFRATGAGGPVGTLTIEDVDVSGAGGIFNLPSGTGGTLDVTFDSIASTSIIGGAAIEVHSASGSFTVDNPGAGIDTSIAGEAGISIQGSPGASFSFGETDLDISLTGGDAIDLGGATPSAGATFTFDSLAVTTGGNGLLGRGASTLNIGGTASTIAATGGAAVDIEDMTLDNGAAGGGLTFASLSSNGSATDGIRLDGITGTFTVAGTVDIDDPTSDGIDISGVNGAGNSVTFSGAAKSITDTASTGPDGGNGVTLANSDVDFTGGGLDIDTTTGVGFAATGGGTLNVTGAGNTIDVAGMATHALDLNGVAIGGDDVTFASITANGGVTAEGIDIDATTNAGAFNGGDVTLTGTQGNGIDINGSSAAFNFSSANITNSAGAGINLAGMNGVVTFSAVDIDGSGGAALQVTGNTSAVNVDGGTIGAAADNGSASAASVDVDNAAASITIAASIKNTADRAVEITGSGVGTFAFTGAIDEDGTGIRLDNNDQGGNATITFSGGLALDTGASTAFTATNGGIVEVCDDDACNGTGAAVANTIGSAGTPLMASAVVITDTTIGSNDVAFRSIHVDGGGGASVAINLASTGSGEFKVTGVDGPCGNTGMALDCDGGTIENIVGDAVTLDNTGGRVTFENMLFEDIGSTAGAIDTRSQHDAIHGQAVGGGLTLDNTIIRKISDQAVNGADFADGVSVTTWTGLTVVDSLLEDSNRFHVAGVADNQDEGAIRIVGIDGTVSVTGSVFRRGAALLELFSDATGSLDVTVQESDFTDAYKEFTSGGTASLGRTCISVTAEGSSTTTVTIGDQTNMVAGHQASDSGNLFLNCKFASILVAHQGGATGNLDAIVANNTFRVTDHSSTLGTFGNFPQGGVALRMRGGTLDGIVEYNTFGVFVPPDDRLGSTTDEIMNAAGGDGNVSLILENATGGGVGAINGAAQVEVNNNEFNGSINSPFLVRADRNQSAAVYFHDNTYVGRDDFFSPDPFFGTFTVPGIPSRVRVRNGGSLDVTFENETMVFHDQAFFPQTETVEIQSLDVGGGGTMCVALDSVVSPDGFELTEENGVGTVTMYQGTVNNAATGPCTAGSTGDCEAELGDDGVRGGPVGRDQATGAPDATLNPPFVDVDGGSIAIVGTACATPSGGIF